MVDEIHYYFAIVFRYENTYYLRLSTSVRNMKLDVRGDIMAIYQFPVTDHTTTVTNYLSVEYDIFQEDESEYHMLVLGCVNILAQLVGCLPQLLF